MCRVLAALALSTLVGACSSSTTTDSVDAGSGGSDAAAGGTAGSPSNGGASSTGGSSSGGGAGCEPQTCKIGCCATAHPNQAQTLFDLMTKDYCPGSGCTGVCPSECDNLLVPLDAIRCFKCLLGDTQSWAKDIANDCAQLDQCSALLTCVGQCAAK